jgi:2-oxo-4-hydroxy-4-carboxy-5-ureidoimidazoline decarboxylase
VTLEELTACCGSTEWAAAMLARQPFAGRVEMHAAADEVWWGLTEEDWLEAFSKHPKIGQKSSARWSSEEQNGMRQATREIELEMARLNAEYEAKFGFIFIVCATGKSADEMLQVITTRLNNSRGEEIRNAATEQAKITHLRLDKL